MIDKDTADVIRVAIFIYLVLFPSGIIVFYIGQMIGEWRMRRRIRRIMERWDK
jgi:hypothetical protein